MKDSKIQNQSFLRNINRKTILNFLMKEKMSCSDLAKKMKLSNTAIGKITDELVRYNILMKHESETSEVGRRPIMLEINPDAGIMFIISLAGKQAYAAAVNMSGKTIRRKDFDLGSKITRALLDEIIGYVKNVHSKYYADKLLTAICIATPGKIDPVSGNFLLAHNFVDYKKINLREIFGSHFDCEILISNDLKFALEGERIYGRLLLGIKNAMLLHIGYSVGSALMLNENIYSGAHGFAGELTGFSLNTLADSGDMFFPKDLNSLYSVSVDGLLKTIKHSAWTSEDAPEVFKNSFTLDDVTKAYAEENPFIKNLVEQTAMIWARVIRNMTEFLDIETVIINGSVTRFGERFKEIIEGYVNSFLDYQQLKIFFTELGDEGVMQGAVYTAVKASLNTLINGIKQ